jgi:osmoprotectant transport system substrate-binding protein
MRSWNQIQNEVNHALASKVSKPVPMLLWSLVLLVSAVLGCRTANTDPFRNTRPVVRIGSTNFAEQLVLAELYAHALEANGYRVERQLGLGSRESVEPALEANRIDLYPEYLATLLAYVSRGATRGSSDAGETHAALRQALEPRGISVLDFAPAVNTNGFVVTRQTADRLKLSRLSDLAPVSEQLILGGSSECPIRPFCLVGLRDVYGIRFRDYRILDTGGPLTVAALDSGQVDVGVLFTTDPIIRSRQYVLLADDRNLQLADNVAPVVRMDLIKKAPNSFAGLLNAVSAKLTTDELTRLNSLVALEGQEPRVAAAAWLQANGLLK